MYLEIIYLIYLYQKDFTRKKKPYKGWYDIKKQIKQTKDIFSLFFTRYIFLPVFELLILFSYTDNYFSIVHLNTPSREDIMHQFSIIIFLLSCFIDW